jgi:glycosyltransferase involved in cell wall biosynthesis
MKTIWMAKGDSAVAQTWYRSQMPWQFCKDELAPDITLELNSSLQKKVDAVVFTHRVAAPHWVEVIETMKKEGTRIAIETDDDIWNIPPHNPAISTFGQIERDTLSFVMSLADMVIVSTPPLKQVVTEHLNDPKQKDKIKICPNLHDWTLYDVRPRMPGPIKILWTGSVHHEKDLEEIAEPLERLLLEFGNDIQVLFQGALPWALTDYQPISGTNLAKIIPTKRFSNIGYVNPISLEHYPASLCDIAPDIALCPLTSETFNNSKSGNKACECALAGAAIIASDMPPYRNMANGAIYIKPGDAGGWYREIKSMIEVNKWRRKMQELARHHVMQNWCWQSEGSKKPWVNAFKELVA